MKLFAFIFSGVGLLLLSIAAYLFFQEKEFIAHAQTSTGKVTALRRNVDSKGGVTYYPEVSYTTPDGKVHVFDSNYGSNPASYAVGEEVEIYYQPGKPAEAEIKGFMSQWLAVMITGFLGTIFSTIGGGVALSLLKTRKKHQHLIIYGKKIRTKVIATERNTLERVNGRSPFVVHTQWLNPQTNQIHVFKSDNIWYDPREYMPEFIDVMIDPDDPKKYHMDLSAPPKMEHY